jgi:hypothetical protein
MDETRAHTRWRRRQRRVRIASDLGLTAMALLLTAITAQAAALAFADGGQFGRTVLGPAWAVIAGVGVFVVVVTARDAWIAWRDR